MVKTVKPIVRFAAASAAASSWFFNSEIMAYSNQRGAAAGGGGSGTTAGQSSLHHRMCPSIPITAVSLTAQFHPINNPPHCNSSSSLASTPLLLYPHPFARLQSSSRANQQLIPHEIYIMHDTIRPILKTFSLRYQIHKGSDDVSFSSFTIEAEAAFVAMDLELMVMSEGRSDSYDDFGHDDNAKIVTENTGAADKRRPRHKKNGQSTVHRGQSRS
ncbi:hypothetical protein CABS01_11731 [Colletotrichum abscissum]|uniref:Uncharacterized protein n=1 Tax=Colletotrichum abscissum TaxID=1671311 RepID=A0A9P9XD98_9PEZI|nr:uncharacterized protein CABS01_11731 [Colletotrichum abscissum]KAI3548686.1 hypothetical protein CABS02_08216 [Colletotrichum abscissum]KAK1492834.1 hypothetical protein CABS01_11731 [Colletotrichum abscissum]